MIKLTSRESIFSRALNISCMYIEKWFYLQDVTNDLSVLCLLVIMYLTAFYSGYNLTCCMQVEN